MISWPIIFMLARVSPFLATLLAALLLFGAP
jgi:hypothetical protein